MEPEVESQRRAERLLSKQQEASLRYRETHKDDIKRRAKERYQLMREAYLKKQGERNKVNCEVVKRYRATVQKEALELIAKLEEKIKTLE